MINNTTDDAKDVSKSTSPTSDRSSLPFSDLNMNSKYIYPYVHTACTKSISPSNFNYDFSFGITGPFLINPDSRKEMKEVSNTFPSILYHSAKIGIAGGCAMYINIFSLMWLYTSIAYQNVKGCSSLDAIRTLYSEGGLLRFYRGLLPALFMGPLCRFGDTFSNHIVLQTLDDCFSSSQDISIAIKTLPASGISALWRLLLFPIDTMLTINQVKGCSIRGSFRRMLRKYKGMGLSGVYSGSGIYFTGNLCSHWTWFTTYNYLHLIFIRGTQSCQTGYFVSHRKEKWQSNNFKQKEKTSKNSFHDFFALSEQNFFCLRNGLIGTCASIASDCFSNFFYVIKTNKQSSLQSLSNCQAVVKAGGWTQSFTRGLPLRIIGNGLQGFLFGASWSLLRMGIDQK